MTDARPQPQEERLSDDSPVVALERAAWSRSRLRTAQARSFLQAHIASLTKELEEARQYTIDLQHDRRREIDRKSYWQSRAQQAEAELEEARKQVAWELETEANLKALCREQMKRAEKAESELEEARKERDDFAAEVEADKLRKQALQDSINGCAQRVAALTKEQDELKRQVLGAGASPEGRYPMSLGSAVAKIEALSARVASLQKERDELRRQVEGK